MVILKKQAFYYDFHKVGDWLIVNFALSILVVCWVLADPALMTWKQMHVLMGLSLLSWLGWLYKYVKKQRMALVDNTGIIIDTCDLLKWRDIRAAEERIVRCGFKKVRILVLLPKATINYRYNFLQRHNGCFTPFSIPLYGILKPKDEQTLISIVRRQVKNTKLLKD